MGYGACVKDFYGAWSNFTSVKTFIWFDKWRLSDAPNRNVRRQMEKENRKAREAARKEYNDTIRVNLKTLMHSQAIHFCTCRILQSSFVNEIPE